MTLKIGSASCIFGLTKDLEEYLREGIFPYLERFFKNRICVHKLKTNTVSEKYRKYFISCIFSFWVLKTGPELYFGFLKY